MTTTSISVHSMDKVVLTVHIVDENYFALDFGTGVLVNVHGPNRGIELRDKLIEAFPLVSDVDTSAAVAELDTPHFAESVPDPHYPDCGAGVDENCDGDANNCPRIGTGMYAPETDADGYVG